jgi:hypothetical protein
MTPGTDDDQSFLKALIGDLRPPLALTGVMFLGRRALVES